MCLLIVKVVGFIVSWRLVVEVILFIMLSVHTGDLCRTCKHTQMRTHIHTHMNKRNTGDLYVAGYKNKSPTEDIFCEYW